ncbi:GTPase Era [Thiohalorhabdus methylotrophus]|uniref:GTPase Era n=1 Tax=Thiohalorhabdus methylotrophus TaxID=3242694 RepID=A0ABV4TYU8_9GAMM
MSEGSGFRSGMVALVGRPNVGKSTLMNAILGEKISIVSRRPQTTRHRLLGVHTAEDAQMVFVDTPGIHQSKKKINQYMVQAAISALDGVDAVVFVVEALSWTDGDAAILDRLSEVGTPVIAVINKSDRVSPRERLLPFLEEMQDRHAFAALVPLSAERRDNLEPLLAEIAGHLPEGPPLFPEDQITDRSLRFLCAELIREQVFHQLGEEVPYATEVQVEQFQEEEGLARINATVLVEREGQKAIVLGREGRRIKAIGTQARQAIEHLLEARVHLELFVRVREGWTGDDRALRELGYED